MDGNTVSTRPAQLRPSAEARGRGWLSLEKISPAPAAGASYTYVCDGTYWRRLLAVAFTFTPSATVAIRTVGVAFADGDGFVFNNTLIAGSIAASQAASYYGDPAQTSPVEGPTSLGAEGSVTSPGTFANIASSAVLPAGQYTATVTINMAGTLVQAADANNTRLVAGGNVITVLDNNIGSAPQTFGPFDFEVQASGTIQVQTAGNTPTTGSIYSAEITITPAQYEFEFTIPDFVVKSGWQIQVNVGNAQAADQLSAIALLFERFPSSEASMGKHHVVDDLAAAILAAIGSG